MFKLSSKGGRNVMKNYMIINQHNRIYFLEYDWKLLIRLCENGGVKKFWFTKGENELKARRNFIDKYLISRFERINHDKLTNNDHNLRNNEKNNILMALEKTNFVQAQAAKLLGITRRNLNYKVTKLGITHPNWRKNNNGKLNLTILK